MSTLKIPRLSFVCCANDVSVLGQRLLASPCLREGSHPLTLHFNASNAAAGFNSAMRAEPESDWLVWVHQDVFLPAGWDARFALAIAAAQAQFATLAVVGVYGVAGSGPNAMRVGHILNQGSVLHEAAPMPHRVDSLDELLFAVHVGTPLKLDPALGYDLYATDLVLCAQALGLQACVVDAPCEHWSSTPASGEVKPQVMARVAASAAVFEAKWERQFPITTPCFAINAKGDVQRFLEQNFTSRQP